MCPMDEATHRKLTQMPKGQKNTFHNDNPIGQTGVREMRQTGVQPVATAVLRSQIAGKSEGRNDVNPV